MRARIGTSGFSYKEWKGPFYPGQIKNDRMLAYYGEHFDTVEINNTFHRMPRVELLETWAAQVPEDFSFVLKSPRRISHKKGFDGVGEPLETFANNSATLGQRLGPALFQFPPWLKKDFDVLGRLTEFIPDGFRCALEFRHESWFDEETREFLSDRGLALVVSDQKLAEPPVARTAPFGYVRFRRDAYSDDEMSAWAGKLTQTGWDELYVFFKHEDEGAAPKMAMRFREVLS
ncbi:MAG: DUF72 domain-containing protein [Acidobacteria bacterium]|nr:DUF72 domain-containing protein [Acidobacteriota bacterium]NIM62532.1 DUF72 domain-containing protein [Acidobacteriota bacterium]NIO60738.1 DUF72 domain-containing protein [Acidobacteriota bacterium]NIQ31801.1 DUF72 domain-containing protein [Acidobacteriota bacterium]NIQ86659.1 DUF72 domain-containing protein [Acidobacteriota bacterium]